MKLGMGETARLLAVAPASVLTSGTPPAFAPKRT